MISIIVFVILTIVALFGLWKLLIKAGKQGWESIVPFYREYVFAKLTGRPTWHVYLLVIPIVNIFVFYGLYLDFIKSFGKFRFWEHAAAVLVPFIVLPMWANDPKVKYLGLSTTEEFKKKYPYKKTMAREWADAIVFAIVAAYFIRSFVIELYFIPSGSMEKTLMTGDCIVVSKFHYGVRLPITPLAFPLAHHTMPLLGTKAYSTLIQWPYRRLPGLQDIKRNDIFVFNLPEEADPPLSRPIDKRENLIKRCVGAPGDIITLKESVLYVNGQPGFVPEDGVMDYFVFTDGTGLNPDRMLDKRIEFYSAGQEPYQVFLTKTELADMKTWPNVKQIIPNIAKPSDVDQGEGIFPHHPNYHWNVDNFGPLHIPEKGWTVQLDSMTMPLYERAIRVYEGNEVEVKGQDIFINGVKSTSYTFKMNYYWMMGDNRHNSRDARVWGLVPEDHIVGKPLIVLYSKDKDGSWLSSFRWNRTFKSIND